MPQLHPSRRTGRRLVVGGLLSAVVVLGTPAVASAEDNPLTSVLEQVPGVGSAAGTGTGGASAPTSVVPGFGGLPSLPGGGASSPDPTAVISGGAACVQGLATGIQVSVTGLATGLTQALIGLLGGGASPAAVQGGTATTTIPITQAQLLDLLDLSPEAIADLFENGQQSLTMGVQVVVDGVTKVVQVVLDFAQCLAALIPTPAPAAPTTTQAPPAAAPTQAAAPAITTSAAPAQAVAYPGYAPTGGAPSDDDGSPAALVGLGLLTAATGGGALWLWARRGVAG
ncbi:unannotated protein [freshwater metagenome]|uniref:Unannotated protein n=1 Tax=freshwater metagenome TaxID=449393 RepID=A0A6J7GDG6_9ZZZZ